MATTANSELELRQVLADVSAELERAQSTIDSLLKNIGDTGECRGCGQPIKWVRHRNGKVVPYDLAGVNHFVGCPVGHQFKRQEKGTL